ncbi:uncharacterized protein SPSK_02350 [Sporothrix schenckii 1099-18]|uniref:RCC1-like domain-containing protein n=1 Tax=Sporothrix schenckii 1099-18 TaxID=1397361 RepID=A0A0F2MB65_SPOSC|nr:uncharacterized protein SPSK_02350 [Sporothrix schenckii 1099-18]KJR86329.1 hypothetical protein SPSK_02350 [Sporothrix schenckii 1099-18]
MPPRKATTTAKAAAPASKKTAAAVKADKVAPAKAAPAKAASTATKRKRAADDDEPVPKTNGVNGVVHGDAKPAKKAKKETTPAPPAATKKAAAPRTKTPAAAPDADKENSAPTTNGDKTTKKRAKSTTPTPPAAKAKVAKVSAAAKRKAEAEKTAAEAEAKDKKEEEEEEEATAPATKKAKAPKVAATAAAIKPADKIGVKINDAPTKPLEIFVFGEGSAGELGLGAVAVNGKKPVDVKRPRLNANLDPSKVGVVQVATGGMHSVVLTKDNKILTWGVNDQGALGRDTTWDGGLRDADADDDGSDSDSDDDDTGLNPHESTPGEIDTSGVVPGTKFVQVVASDSASFALTEDGRVYGWGTFRASDGILGFSRLVDVQKTPVLLPEPKKIKALATGSNHILALDAKGKLFTWGCPEQNQLGRRCVQRDIKESALRPGGVGFKRGVHIAKIACGSYHSFALDQNGQVYAWGLNNFGQLNVEQGAGDTDATVLNATIIEGLAGHRVADIDGGEHHSVACTADGKLFTWGRIDGRQLGFAKSFFNEANAIFDEYGKPRILKAPTLVSGAPTNVAAVDAGTDNTFALTRDGKVYSWGFSGNYQTGQGTIDDIETPTLIDNTAVRDKKLVFAGAGGQFSILASVAE